MSYAPGLFGRVAYRRSGYVGPRLTLDVVDDISRHGRVEFLVEDHIDLKKGKAYDAHLQMPRRFGDDNFAGPTGGAAAMPAGGQHGRVSYRGLGSQPTLLVSLTKTRITKPSVLQGE